MKKKKPYSRPNHIRAIERAKLYCMNCNRFVYGTCMTQEWHDHLGKSTILHLREDYRRRYYCPFCDGYIECTKGTYLPSSAIIPSPALRKGREMTYDLLKQINEEFKLKCLEIGTCLGFNNYRDIKTCSNLEKLRKAYRTGVKLQEELRRMENEYPDST